MNPVHVILSGVIAILIVVLLYNGLTGFERPEIIISATISVFGTSIAAFLGYVLWLSQHRADRQAEKDSKANRQYRLLIALRAELFENVEGHLAQFNPDTIKTAKNRILEQINTAEAGQHSMPMATVKLENDIFDNIKPEIADLPEETLSPVIRYYQLDEFVAETLTAFSRGDFEKLSKERRRNSVIAFYALGVQALEASIKAFDAVDEAAGNPNDVLSQRIAEIAQSLARQKTAQERSNDDNRGGQ